MNKIIEVKNVSYSVGNERDYSLILNDISFDLNKNQTLGIAGESGSGKTTLAKLIAGILFPTNGEIRYNFDTKFKNNKTKPVQILFQNNGEIINPFRKINDIVDEAINITSGKENLKDKRESIFNSLNFEKKLWDRKGFELSGGEQQRAALARLLAIKPELLNLR